MRKKLASSAISLITLISLISLSPPTTFALELSEAFLLGKDEEGRLTYVAETFPDFGTLVSNLLPNLFILAGLILFFIILGAGFVYIKSGGSNEEKDKSKQAMTGAIIGFVLIFASYWIIQIIEVLTGIPIL